LCLSKEKFKRFRVDGGGFLCQAPVGGYEGRFKESLRSYQPARSGDSFNKTGKSGDSDLSKRERTMYSRLSTPKFRMRTFYVDPSPIEINKGQWRLRPNSVNYTWHVLKD
jgi:hypothetical protein